MISVALLGPVEVSRDGQRVRVPGGKTTELLVHLALSAGTMVRTDRLIEDLWGERAVDTGRNTLHSKVSRLRRALGDPDLVAGSAAGYTLELDAASVDALEVTRLADEVAALRQAGDAAAAVDACSAALAMFRGESLFDATEADWLTPHRTQFEGLRLRLIEDRLGARMDLGATGEVVGELEELVAAHPLREGLWGLLITALYRSGRQADALAAYRAVRERLADELGLDPGPDLRRLEQQVLQQDPALDAPTSSRPVVDTSTPDGNLPVLTSSIVGREGELATVGERLASHRWVTLVGPAGVGKTRLAIEAARRAEPVDGAWLVRLENARTAESVLETVVEALHAERPSPAGLIERLRGADVLVVLDNCEHVVDAVAELVGPLLRGDRVRVLATSQVQLGIDGESVYGLQPLTFADSVELFASRAADHGPEVIIDAEARTVVEDVCRALDGLLLAIELAAARTRSLSIQEISRRLEDRFRVLSDPTNRRSERQRTLSGAIAWSYDLLFPDDQRGLWALACFVGGAPLAAAERVLAALGVPDEAAVDVVGRLVDRSLVAFEPGPDGEVRYRLLDSVRAFALDRLEESGLGDRARRAHAGWVAACAAAAQAGVRGPGQARHLAFARDERANIDAALAWASMHDPALGVAMASDLGWTWVVLGDAVGAQRLRDALAATEEAEVDVERRVVALLSIGWLDAAAGNVEDARQAVETAMQVLEPWAGDELRAKAAFYVAYVMAQRAQFQESLALLADARLVFRRLGCVWDEAAGDVLTAHNAIASGDRGEAVVACDEAARLLDEVRDPWLLVQADAMRGAVAQAEQRFDDACVHLARAAEESAKLGFASAEAYHLANLGRALQQRGDLAGAARTLASAVEVARATGDLRVAALARVRLGRVLRARHEHEAARTMVRSAQDWYRASGGGDGARLADCLMLSMSDPGDGPARLEELEVVLVAAREAGDLEVEVLALDALARRHAEAGDTPAALELLATADDLMPVARHHVTDDDRVDAERARQLISR